MKQLGSQHPTYNKHSKQSMTSIIELVIKIETIKVDEGCNAYGYYGFITLHWIIRSSINIGNNYSERICTMPMYISNQAYVTITRYAMQPSFILHFQAISQPQSNNNHHSMSIFHHLSSFSTPIITLNSCPNHMFSVLTLSLSSLPLTPPILRQK
jgi:hypothetical protein